MTEVVGMITTAIIFGIIFLFFFGLLIAGVACLLIYAKRDANGDKPGAGLSVAAALLMGIGGVAAYFVAYIFVVVCVGMQGMLSEDVSKYEVIDYISEDYEYFTVNGERYDLLDLSANYDVCSEIGVGWFLEELDGEYYTYYYIPNEEDFKLIFDGCMYMYAPKAQHDAIYREYDDEYADSWIMYGNSLLEGDTLLPEDVSDTLTAIMNGIPDDRIRLVTLANPEFISLSLPSEDGIFSLLEMSAVRDSGKLYILTGFGMAENQYYLYEIPIDIAAKLSMIK